MSDSILEELIEYKRGIIESNRDYYRGLTKDVPKNSNPHAFKKGITSPGQINLIAEIKKASPSKGVIRGDFDLIAIAKIYEEHKAAAISVLTEDKYFLGKPEYITQVSSEVNIPVLTKDFILSQGQIYEAFINGASAILLIVAILDEGTLKDFIEVSRSLGIDSLVEVHSEQELQQAVDAGAEIIGINNRDLSTFVVDTGTCLRLVPSIPPDKIIVAESGYKTHNEIKMLEKVGVHAVLIGETFMQEQDIGQKIDELMLDK